MMSSQYEEVEENGNPGRVLKVQLKGRDAALKLMGSSGSLSGQYTTSGMSLFHAMLLSASEIMISLKENKHSSL